MFEDVNRDFTEHIEGCGDWCAYGGHRLWQAPEVLPETYCPDNAACEYKAEGGTVTVSAPVTPFGKKFEITAEISGDKPEVLITNKIYNLSGKPCEIAPWSITSLARGGVCLVPLCTSQTGYLPNRVISLWDYSDVADPRFSLTDSEARLRQDSSAEKPFKVGFNVNDGFAAYKVNGQIFAKCFSPYHEGLYPDFCCNFETYTNKLFLECEIVGEKQTVPNGGTAELSEKWRIFPGNIDFRGTDAKQRIAEKINKLKGGAYI